MKAANPHKPRNRKLSLTLIALLSSTFLILAWEKIPFLASFKPIQERFDIVSPEVLNINPALDSIKYGNQSLAAMSVQNEKIDITGQQTDEVVFDKKENHQQPTGDTQIPRLTEDAELDNLTSTTTTTRLCNFAKGRWVADKRRPLYSGFGCQQWLSPMWACRRMNRSDFFFEDFQWQPEGCKMPDFQGSRFLKRMQDKTIALVGDSLGRQQFQSLMCMVTGGEEHPEVEDIGIEYGLTKPPGSVRPNGWAYHFPGTNTTILYYWSASLCELEPLNVSDPATRYAMHLDRPVAFLKENLPRIDVLVLNTGHHWNRGKFASNRWEMYVGGKPNNDRKLAGIWEAKNFAVNSVIRWLDSQLLRYPRLETFYRTISPRHFANGDWNTGGRCDNTVPLAGGSDVVQDSSADPDAEHATKGTRVRLLDITALSQLRDEAHISKYSRPGQGAYDCLHWCLPGVPDTWNEILAAHF